MNSDLKISNVFGITPTRNFVAAGMDFYVPNIENITDTDKVNKILNAFSKSYNVTVDYMDEVLKIIRSCIVSPMFEKNALNLLMLYLSFSDKTIGKIHMKNINSYLKTRVLTFMQNYVVYDDNNTPGVRMTPHSTLFINSGIKVALPHNTAGIFFNKSGRGTKGFDVRAQVVDEDYAGFVHLNVAYTKDVTFDNNNIDNVIYCGDKLTQMVLLPVIYPNIIEVDDNEYVDIMSNSQRGNAGFGSSDEKH